MCLLSFYSANPKLKVYVDYQVKVDTVKCLAVYFLKQNIRLVSFQFSRGTVDSRRPSKESEVQHL